MFSINIYLKLAIVALSLIGGIILAFVYGFWYSLPFLLIGIGFLLSYIFLGTVQSAAPMIQAMDFVGAEKRLNMTLKPDWLYKTNRAFYYIMQGTLALQKKENDKAEELLNKAESLELPSDNEKAMVALQLANLHSAKGKWAAAKIQVQKMKKLKVTESQLKDQIKQFEKAFSNRGQAAHLSQRSHGRGSRKKGYRGF
ncbi:MAG: hypothetical protein HKN16_02725 [Saprospiraceae bacterium]|nr:hypothetical protein [Saprospiraceae bacterium]